LAPRPDSVVVFRARNELEAQLARDVLLAAGLPVLHVPSLSTGIFGVAETTRIAVPQDAVEDALLVLAGAGLEGSAEPVPGGLSQFGEAMEGRFPVHRAQPLGAGSSLRWVMITILAVIAGLVVWSLLRS
jgi:hypothetical protein